MDKKKYEVKIAGVDMALLTDEREEFVTRLVSKLNADITAITVQNRHCSKLDAALLVALEESSERTKAEKRVRNLEAQIALYDANLRRMREENIKLKSAMLGKSDSGYTPEVIESVETVETVESVENEEVKEDQLTIETETAIEPQLAAETADEEAPEEEKAAAPENKVDKLRKIESLLRGRNI